MIKRLLSLVILCSFLTINSAAFSADSLPNTETKIKNLKNVKVEIDEKGKKKKQKKYKYKTVLKYYIPYEVNITNNNSKAVLLNANTDVDLIMEDGAEVKSQSRRDIYKRTRKRDMGRYYGFALPGAAIAGAITGITFFIGAPLGALIAVGTFEPTNKAVRGNVDISQELYNSGDLPIRMESGKTYPVHFYVPKKEYVKAIRINNMTLENSTTNYELVINIPSENGDEL